MSLDQKIIEDFYNSIDNIWDSKDLWHMYSFNQISRYLKKHTFSPESYILNAGSGGNDYGIRAKIHHVDIAENKIKSCPLFTTSSIEDLPFDNNVFDGIICVGSVINYCDAFRVVSEFSRVLRKGGTLILEFESSSGFEYRHMEYYKSSSCSVTVKFRGQAHNQYLFSPTYIFKILKNFNFKIAKKQNFHIFSAYKLSQGLTEEKATKWAKYDKFISWIRPLANHSNNIIITCIKK